jgi:hypothetical protein
VPDKELAFRGQANRAGIAMEERQAQNFFEVANLMADSRRRQVEFFRSLGKVEMPGRSLEGFESMQGRQAAHIALVRERAGR